MGERMPSAPTADGLRILGYQVFLNYGTAHDSWESIRIEELSGYRGTGELVCAAVLPAILSRLVWC